MRRHKQSSVCNSAFFLRLLVFFGFVVVTKLIWDTLITMRSTIPSLDDYSVEGNDQFANFRPKSCVLDEEGKCKIINVNDQSFIGKGLYAKKDSFYLDGRPFRIYSGTFHYFRTHHFQWGDRLLRMKAAGLNTVETYIPWNFHMRSPNMYSFTGMGDIISFIKQVKSLGFLMIVRPGPYICAEWDFGGLPSWLLHDPMMQVRTSKYAQYLSQVEEYFDQLLPKLNAYSYKNGGPIIAYQVENEFGAFGNDPAYMQALVKMFDKWNVNELLFTSDGSWDMKSGSVPGVLATINFQQKAEEQFSRFRQFQPDKPIFVAEFWAGWFDHWTEKHHITKPASFEETVRAVLKANASINFFVFVGGTNFEFWNGANNNSGKYEPTITSYDYNAPVSEWGDITKKFHIVRQLAQEFGITTHDLPDVPPDPPKEDYGKVAVTGCLYLADLVALVEESDVHKLKELVPMEALNINNNGGQSFGWLLYRTLFYDAGKTMLIKGVVFDRAQVFVNGVEVAIIDWTTNNKNVQSVQLEGAHRGENVLEILVENMGRVNYVRSEGAFVLSEQRKGILGNVYIDDKLISDWTHIPLEFSDRFKYFLKKSSWKPVLEPRKGPIAFLAVIHIKDKPKDTFLHMKNWTKGIVLVNGFNIGRYWSVGPQETLYIPAPLLVSGKNEIIVFELHKPSTNIIFSKLPILGPIVESDA